MNAPVRPNQPITLAQGFTLLELLVALAIFGFIGIIAYQGLDSVLDANAAVTAQADRSAELQRAFLVMETDMAHFVSRPIRNEYGDSESELIGGNGGSLMVQFTRSGRRNPADLPRSELMRVAIGIEEDRLMRAFWQTVDRAQDSEPVKQVLIRRVRQAEIRFLGPDREWRDFWPPVTASDEPSGPPLGIELQIDTEDMGRITRLFTLAGALK